MNKHLTHTALALVATAALNTACTFEQEDYFDESASLRITHLNENIQQRLVSQSDTTQGRHGWVIQYFVAGTDDYDFEGFNLLGRFSNNGSVTLAGDHRFLRNNSGKYTEHTSTYEMLAEEGPVLSFNTWNDVLTVFEDPVDPTQAPKGVIVQDGEGMNGDHNMVLRSFTDDEILFRGERHAAAIRFIPCDRPWREYLTATAAMKNYITNPDINSYYVVNGADTMYFVNLRRGYFTYAERVFDPLLPRTEQCVFTPQGFRMQHQDTIAGNIFQEFRLAADSSCLVSQDGNVRVMATWDQYVADFADVWQLDNDNFTEQQQQLFTAIGQEIKKFSSKWSIKSVGVGEAGDFTGLVFTFYTSANKKNTNTIAMAMDLNRTAYGQMHISYDDEPEIDSNMQNAFNRGATQIVELAKQFAATISGNYDMKPDSYFLPTKVTFVPQGAGTTFEMSL